MLGIGDDAALLELPQGTDLVAAVDTIVAGRHFPEGADARAIGHRALAVNLSDMAAMGATPAWATLALTMPSADPQWLEAFAAGFLDLADAHGQWRWSAATRRAVRSPSACRFSGHVPHGAALRRSGAAGRRSVGGQRHVWAMPPRALPFCRCRRRSRRRACEELIRRFRLSDTASAARPGGARHCQRGDGSIRRSGRAICRNWRRPAVSRRTSTSSDCRLSRACAMPSMKPSKRAIGRSRGGDDYELLFAVPPQALPRAAIGGGCN